MREADHRIANNLAVVASLVRSEAKRFASDAPVPASEVRSTLASISTRIDSISRLHRLIRHSASGAQVNVADYLHEVTDATISSIDPGNQILFELTPEVVVAPKLAAAIGLFVCEAFTNAVKYAHPSGVAGKIWISCEIAGDRLQVAVTDDGVGLPENFDPQAATSNGFVVMKALTDQAGGTMRVANSGLGLSVRMILPLSASAGIA